MDLFLGYGLTIFSASFLLVYLTRQIALKKNIMDVPNERSSHHAPTPRGGGLGVTIVFYAALFFLWHSDRVSTDVMLSLLGGIFIAIVGYCDDLFGVKAKWRALVHLFSACWALYFLPHHDFYFFGVLTIHTGYIFFAIAAFVMVWFTNMYNFMDGIDGLAGTEAIFVSLVAGCVLFSAGIVGVAMICFAITFSVMGFLCLNWPPAKIFMGDVGSGFLGFIFADLMWITNSFHSIPFLFWWILLGVFITDASCTLIHRMLQKKNWRDAHREHAYQRLVQSGFSHKQVTLCVFLVNLLICLPVSLVYLHIDNHIVFALYAISMIIAFWLAWILITKKYAVI